MLYLGLGCRVLLAAVFVFSAVSKVRGRSELRGFTASVRGFGVPARRAPQVAAAVIAGEFAAAVLLPFPVTALAGTALAGVLLVGFTAGIALVLRRGDQVGCRCFDASAQPVGPRHLLRNGVLLAAVAAAAAAAVSGPTIGYTTAGVLLAGFAAVVLAILVAAFDDLAALFRPMA